MRASGGAEAERAVEVLQNRILDGTENMAELSRAERISHAGRCMRANA